MIGMSLLDYVADTHEDWDIPNPVRTSNILLNCRQWSRGHMANDIGRYNGWTLDQIIAALRGARRCNC